MIWTRLVFLPALFGTLTLRAQEAKIIEIENIVQASKGEGAWSVAARDQTLAIKDRIRTRQRSRASVRLTDLYTMRMEQFTTIEITPALVSNDKAQLDLTGGAVFLFSREKEGEIGIRTPAANGALRGTQLFVRVSPGGHSLYQVLEGKVELSNPHGNLTLNAGEAGEAVLGSAPRRTAVIEASNILQWALYYPAVLDPAELNLSAAEGRAVAASLAAYQSGNLPEAMELYPNYEPASDGGRLYKAAVLLAVGRVDEASGLLTKTSREAAGRRAIRRMIAAVMNPDTETDVWPGETLKTAGEALAESYFQQSRANLWLARSAAERATVNSPENGYAWVRLAELEFSFSRHKEARAALERGLALTPQNARAHALLGYVYSAENRIEAARLSFGRATELEGALGSAWMGLGLKKIKRGDPAGGRADLQTAATVEPTISFFHSYLGKALSAEGRGAEARKDLDLARRLDANDPTPLLYSAIEHQRNNRTNTAIAELEESIRLNDNRRLYRSRFLLDQDRAVRSANLARIYQNAGMADVAVREATRAVESDYTNASAHLFLANSFDALRDPRRIALRYETPWFNELLLSNLLSPVGGGPLSQYVSQQEYSKMLERDGMGGSITNEWRSTDEWRSNASVFGTYGNLSFGLDGAWRNESGQRLNAEAELAEVYGQMKWQATPDDTVYFLGKWAHQTSGDNFETYDNLPLSPGFDFRENQEPGLLLLGWNHQWEPGSNTLFLAGRLSARQRLRDPAANQLLIQRDSAGLRPGFLQPGQDGTDEFTDPALRNASPPAVETGPDGESLVYSPALRQAIAPYLGSGDVLSVGTAPFDFFTEREWEIYTAEVQHIWQKDHNTLLAGARWQTGDFGTRTLMSVQRPNFNGGFSTPAAGQDLRTDFERFSLYAYDYWKPATWLTLIGGAAWDSVDHPDNFRNPPVNDLQRRDEEFSGKLGFTATPSKWVTVRGAYAQGLGGVTYDESVRLEPVQIAGFNQAFRTAISESLAGSVEAPRFETVDLSVEGRLPSRTWWGISFSIIEEDVDRTVGAFTGYDSVVFPNSPAFFPDSTGQRLDYREESLGLNVNQLLGDQFAVGAGYRYTHSELRTAFTDIPSTVLAAADVKDEAALHEFSLFANWNSPRGFFARVEANYFRQELDDDPNAHPVPRSGDSFWQCNAFAGYRWKHNLCEVSAGVLNIGGGDYHLSPLNPYPYLEHDETVVLRCRISF